MLYTYDTRPISLEILSSLRQADVGVAAAYGVVLMLVSARGVRPGLGRAGTGRNARVTAPRRRFPPARGTHRGELRGHGRLHDRAPAVAVLRPRAEGVARDGRRPDRLLLHRPAGGRAVLGAGLRPVRAPAGAAHRAHRVRHRLRRVRRSRRPSGCSSSRGWCRAPAAARPASPRPTSPIRWPRRSGPRRSAGSPRPPRRASRSARRSAPSPRTSAGRRRASWRRRCA